MMNKKIIKQLLLLLITLIPVFANAADAVFIGILNKKSIHSLTFMPDSGKYEVWTNGKMNFSITPDEKAIIVAEGSEVKIIAKDTLVSKNFVLRFIGENKKSTFSISGFSGSATRYSYAGDLLITSNRSRLNLINIVNIDEYLKGVVKAEIGNLSAPEFLKAMAIVSRTYTLKNMYRHSDEGYDLCDRIHCQVYHGVADISRAISEAVEITKGEVVVDKNEELINAVFHSNSGGHTMHAEDVWVSSASYLQARPDPYSRHGNNFYWKKEIKVEDWLAYLCEKTGRKITEFSIDSVYLRSKFYNCGGYHIPLRDIRRDFRLKSTFFVMERNGDILTFYGRGYGHGVGLSQEGANRMAEEGFEYKEIIKYYYSGVEIIHSRSLKLSEK